MSRNPGSLDDCAVQPTSRRRVRAVWALLLAIACGGRTARDVDPAELLARSREILLPAAGPRRVLGRPAGEVIHRRYIPPGAGGLELGGAGPTAVLRGGGADLGELADSLADPDAIAASGLVALASGRTRLAVERLEQAVALRPGDAALLSDLAMAHLELAAGSGGEPLSWVLAYEAAERGLRLDRDEPAVSFNLALALEGLGLAEAAGQAWADYLAVETDPGWRAEALARQLGLRRSTQPRWHELRPLLRARETARAVASRSPEFAREEGWALIAAWASLRLAREAGAASTALAAAGEVALGVERASGEREVSGGVAAIRRAEGSGALAVDRLAAAHAALARGQAAFEAGDYSVAAGELRRARQDLERAGSPFALRAAFYLAAIDFHAGDYRSAHAEQQWIEIEADRRGCGGLAARAAWNQALNLVGLERYADAAAAYERARVRLHALGYRQDLGHVESALGLLRGHLGDEHGAWRFTLSALARLDATFLPVRAYSAYQNAAELALRYGRPQLASLYLDRAVAAGREWGNPGGIAYALAWRGRVRARLGDPSAAVDFAEVESRLAGLTLEELRARIEGDLLVGKAETSVEVDPERELAELSAALARYREAGYLDHVATVHRLRGRRWEALGDRTQAQSDYAASAAIYERRRAHVQDDLRIAFFDESHAPFEALARLALARAEPWEAFGWIERARTRSLAESFRNAGAVGAAGGEVFAGDPRDAIRSALAPGEVLVEYASLDGGLATWAVGTGDELFVHADLEPRDLGDLVRRLRSELVSEARTGVPSATAATLYALLVAPAVRRFPAAATLVFVPAGDLYNVPFAGLRDPETGRHLIESHAVVVAPSATVFRLARARWSGFATADGRGSGWESILLYGDPALDEADRHLGRLAGAAAEVEAIARLFDPGSAIVRRGDDATRARFLSEASDHAVLHLAVHAQANAHQPRSARLLLASEPGRPGSGSLVASDLDGLDLRRTRLAVLGACDTARGFAWKIEGVESLARPFLAAGVPAVVATLWPAADDGARRLLLEFYRRLLAGDDPAQALAGAQRALLASGDPTLRAPHAWAAFQLLGATARPPDHGGAFHLTALGVSPAHSLGGSRR